MYTYPQASTEFLVIIFQTNYRHFWNQACVRDHGVISTSLLVVHPALPLSFSGLENVSFLVLLFLVSQHASQGLLFENPVAGWGQKSFIFLSSLLPTQLQEFSDVSVCVCSVVSDFLWPCGWWSTRLLCLWNFPSKNTKWEGSHFLLQGIFLTQELNLHFLCPLLLQTDHLPLNHLGSPHFGVSAFLWEHQPIGLRSCVSHFVPS